MQNKFLFPLFWPKLLAHTVNARLPRGKVAKLRAQYKIVSLKVKFSLFSRYGLLAYPSILDKHFKRCIMKNVWQVVSSSHLHCIFILMFKVRVYSLCGIGTADSLCTKAELRDLKPKLLCGSGTAERQVAVYFLCGSGTTELPSIIPCAKAELQILNSHNILNAEAELRNLKSQYIPSAEAELRHRVAWEKNIPCAETELKVTVYSLCGSGTVELQVTEHSLCGSGTSSHRIF